MSTQPANITIEARQGRGVRRVRLRLVADESADAAYDWLRDLLPTVRALDAAARRRG